MASPAFNPFPGLRSFEPEEEHLFFGREKHVDDLLRPLRSTRFLAVVGASGSGKSSLVRSGLIPALHRGFMAAAGSRWRVALMRPAANPIGNLAAALDEPDVVGAGGEVGSMSRSMIEATLRRSALGLVDGVRLAHLPSIDNVLVLVDQFEELFRFKQGPSTGDAREEAVAFVKLLVEAVRQEMPRIYVVLTMRSEFIGRCSEFPGLADSVNGGLYLVPRMMRDELRLAITGPVAVAGGSIAPQLVTRLLNSVGDDPDQLPILQHALMRTWDQWAANGKSRSIDVEDYEAIGTLRDALSRHADETYADLPTDRHRDIAEQIFKALVELTPNAGGVRRPCQVAELCAAAGASRDDVIEVVERFRMPGRSLLMPPHGVPLTDTTVIDLSHESLIRVWARLAQWTQEEATSADMYRRLSEAASRYDHGDAGLWRDPELQQAINWRAARRLTSGWAERYASNFDRAIAFLENSQSARDRGINERRRQRRQRLIISRTVSAVLFVLLISSVFSLRFALRQRDQAQEGVLKATQAREEADRQAQIARDQEQNAVSASTAARSAQERAEQERQNAESASRTAESRRQEAEALRSDAVQRSAELERQRQTAEDERAKAITARTQAEAAATEATAARADALRATDAQRLATEAQRRLQYLSLARALAGDAVSQLDPPELRVLMARQAYNLALKHGGDPHAPEIASALRVALENLDSATAREFVGHKDAVRAVALSPDGLVITGSDDGRVRAFDLREPARPPIFEIDLRSPVRAIAVDRENTLVAAGTVSGALHLFSHASRGKTPEIKTWLAHPQGVSDVTFDGASRLLSAGVDGRVRIWQTATATLISQIGEASTRLVAVAINPQGDRLAVASDGGGILLWSYPNPSGGPVTIAGQIRASSVVFSSDGRRLFAGTALGQLLAWDTARLDQAPAVVPAHRGSVSVLRVADGLLASASLDGQVKIWGTHQELLREQPIVLDHSAWVWTLTWSPQGDRIFSGGADRRVRLWATDVDKLAEEACHRVGRSFTQTEWSVHVSEFVEYELTCPVLDRRLDGQPR
jgi:WD40 repeat protein/energy-coupling factor transporter ATP-binding protein EcfA2